MPFDKKLTQEQINEILLILKRGNRAEILIEQGQIVIVEIRRKMRIKG